jgi:MFS transporter, DHA1 family, multidrug resistance protein
MHEINERQQSRNLYILWIGCFLAGCSFSLVMPFLPRFIEELGVTKNVYIWSGWTYAITFVSSSIMAPVWGNLADRYGRKPMIIRSGISIGAVYFLMSLVTGPVQLFGLRALNGALSGFIPSAIALVATNTVEHRVGRALALLQTSTAAGTILGPMLGGTLADLVGIRLTMRIAGSLLVLATVLVYAGVRERILGAGTSRTSPLQDLRVALTNRTLLAVMIATMLISSSIQSLEPILTKFVPQLRFDGWLVWLTHTLFGRGDATAFIAGFIFALPAIATLITTPSWATVGERIGWPRLLALGLGAAGLLVLPQFFVATASALVALRFVYGIFTAAVQPAVNATLAGVVHPSFRGRAYGINQSATAIGAVLGPTLGGYVADWWGPRAVFLLTGVLLLVSAAWVRRELAAGGGNGELVGAPGGA